jgi:hypothetical protein
MADATRYMRTFIHTRHLPELQKYANKDGMCEVEWKKRDAKDSDAQHVYELVPVNKETPPA